jgi:hypothetical protein
MIEDIFHLPAVSTTLVVHLELRISPLIFEKFEMALRSKLIHEKKQKSKISRHCPFNSFVKTVCVYILPMDLSATCVH